MRFSIISVLAILTLKRLLKGLDQFHDVSDSDSDMNSDTETDMESGYEDCIDSNTQNETKEAFNDVNVEKLKPWWQDMEEGEPAEDQIPAPTITKEGEPAEDQIPAPTITREPCLRKLFPTAATPSSAIAPLRPRGFGRGSIRSLVVTPAQTTRGRGRGSRLQMTRGPSPIVQMARRENESSPNYVYPRSYSEVKDVHKILEKQTKILNKDLWNTRHNDGYVRIVEKMLEDVDTIQRNMNTTAQSVLRACGLREKVAPVRYRVFHTCVEMKRKLEHEVGFMNSQQRRWVVPADHNRTWRAGSNFVRQINEIIKITSRDI